MKCDLHIVPSQTIIVENKLTEVRETWEMVVREGGVGEREDNIARTTHA